MNLGGNGGEEKPSLHFLLERQSGAGCLLFLAGAGLGGNGAFFLLIGAAHFGLFLAVFLLIGFGGFVAHNFISFCG